MNFYKYPYQYKDEVVAKFKDYDIVIHTNKEKDYGYLSNDEFVSIEIKNKKGKSLFMNLEDEITILFGDWHMHYTLEDVSDYEEAMEKAYNIINNKECTLVFYCNGKIFGSGSDNKKEYTLEDALDFLKSFFVSGFHPIFKEYGVLVKVCYFDESKNYEIFLDKENFI